MHKELFIKETRFFVEIFDDLFLFAVSSIMVNLQCLLFPRFAVNVGIGFFMLMRKSF